VFDDYKVITLDDGLKVGIFGITTPETKTKTNPNNVKGIDFTNPVPAAQKAVKALHAKNVDVIIALTHLGLDEATKPMWRSDCL